MKDAVTEEDAVTKRIRRMPKVDISAFRVRVDVACNDPDTGAFACQASMISFAGDALTLTANVGDGPTFREVQDRFGLRIRLSYRFWRVIEINRSIGHMAWTGYVMKADDVAEMVEWLKTKVTFSLDGGYAELSDWWDGSAKASMPRERLLELLVEGQMRDKP